MSGTTIVDAISEISIQGINSFHVFGAYLEIKQIYIFLQSGFGNRFRNHDVPLLNLIFQ